MVFGELKIYLHNAVLHLLKHGFPGHCEPHRDARSGLGVRGQLGVSPQLALGRP